MGTNKMEIKNEFCNDHNVWPIHNTYRDSNGKICLKYIQPERPKSYKPNSIYVPPCSEFPSDTVYKRSYEPIDVETQKLCRRKGDPPKSNLTSCGPFSSHTTHRLSFTPIVCPIKSHLHYPHEYNLKGNGPMQDITTHKHDYGPKCIPVVRPFKYLETLTISETPIDHNTTHKVSYTPIDLRNIEFPKPYKPIQDKGHVRDNFPNDTIYKTSYLPIQPSLRQQKPKPTYEKPKVPFSGRTIYTGSYMPPGRFVECNNEPGRYPDEGCYCIYPDENVNDRFKRAHDFSYRENDATSTKTAAIEKTIKQEKIC